MTAVDYIVGASTVLIFWAIVWQLIVIFSEKDPSP